MCNRGKFDKALKCSVSVVIFFFFFWLKPGPKGFKNIVSSPLNFVIRSTYYKIVELYCNLLGSEVLMNRLAFSNTDVSLL